VKILSVCFLLHVAIVAGACPAAGGLVPVEGDEFIGATAGDVVVFSFQKAPLAEPRGGPGLAGSAFIHPLRTPSGFAVTDFQPPDHLHHFGIWWPWKFVEVDGRRHITWELQMGEGEHRAKSARLVSHENSKLTWEFHNETLVKTKGEETRPVIAEHTVASLYHDEEAAAHVLDLEIRHTPVGPAVTIPAHRYSGFCWRGPASWNKDTSEMLTSGGMDRDHANATPARWAMVTGPTPTGQATVLILSAAASIAGGEEKLRVWGSQAHQGVPFINFNPVSGHPQALTEENKAVSHRRYRVIATDRKLDAAAAEKAWHEFQKSLPLSGTINRRRNLAEPDLFSRRAAGARRNR